MNNIIQAAEDLTLAADWLRAHPDLPPIYSIHRYNLGINIGFRVETNADLEALFALTADDGCRTDCRYDDGPYVRIVNGNLLADDRRVSLNVTHEVPAEVSA